MKRIVIIWLLILAVPPAAFLLFMRYRVVVSEGYPTWEAVRNMLVRDGQIVITFPEGVRLLSAKCDDPEASVSIQGQAVITKIGYSWCLIDVEVEIGSERINYRFNPQKLNNWNRMRFEPEDCSDPHSTFKKFENGVLKPHTDLTQRPTLNNARLVPNTPLLAGSLPACE